MTTLKLHHCKQIQVLRNGKFEFWPTCDPSLREFNKGNTIYGLDERGNLRQWECNLDNQRRNKKGKEMSLLDFLQIKYKNSKIDDTLRARRSVKSAVLNECSLDSFDVESEFVKIYNDPYSRDLEEYKAMFDNEIEQLENEYKLRIGRKGLLQQGDGTSRSPRLVVNLLLAREIMSIGTERHRNWTDKVNGILMLEQNYGVVATIELHRSSNEDHKCIEGTTP
ncbi:hypothetical protein Tco_0172639 [Tanacetum coccineum]